MTLTVTTDNSDISVSWHERFHIPIHDHAMLGLRLKHWQQLEEKNFRSLSWGGGVASIVGKETKEMETRVFLGPWNIANEKRSWGVSRTCTRATCIATLSDRLAYDIDRLHIMYDYIFNMWVHNTPAKHVQCTFAWLTSCQNRGADWSGAYFVAQFYKKNALRNLE